MVWQGWCGPLQEWEETKEQAGKQHPWALPWVVTLAGGGSNEHFPLTLCDQNFIPATQSPNSVLCGGVLRGLQAEGAQRRGTSPDLGPERSLARGRMLTRPVAEMGRGSLWD